MRAQLIHTRSASGPIDGAANVRSSRSVTRAWSRDTRDFASAAAAAACARRRNPPCVAAGGAAASAVRMPAVSGGEIDWRMATERVSRSGSPVAANARSYVRAASSGLPSDDWLPASISYQSRLRGSILIASSTTCSAPLTSPDTARYVMSARRPSRERGNATTNFLIVSMAPRRSFWSTITMHRCRMTGQSVGWSSNARSASVRACASAAASPVRW